MANMSKGERRIADILTLANLPYSQEYIFEGLNSTSGRPLRFDFAVFDDENEVWFLIEYQGEQHYKPVKHFNGSQGLQRQRFNDRLKVEFCQERQIPLVVIHYEDYFLLDYDYIMNAVFDNPIL